MYEIYQRDKKQHREGHLSFRVDGLESEMTLDPTQYMPTALVQAISEGMKPGEDAAQRALAICVEMATAVMNRKINKLRNGHQPGGLNPMDGFKQPKGLIDTVAAPGSEGQALEKFLNRGRLCGLTRSEREERHARRARLRIDNDADWKERRKVLFDKANEQLINAKKALANLVREKGEDVSEFEGRQEKINKRIKALETEIAGYKGPFAASHGFQYAYVQYLTKQIDLVNDTIKIWPLMTNTTLDTVRDAVDQFQDVTADEFDGSGYSSGGWTLASKACAVDDANDRAEFDAADYTATSLGAGTRSIQGVALGKYNTSTALSLPLHWIEYASVKTPDGSDFTNVFNAEGILQAADG